MAEERPPAWVPVDQSVGQVPIGITQDVDNTHVSPKSGQDAHTLAAQIVRENQPLINRFVAVQRQQVELAEKDIHNSVLPLRDMTVYYQNVGGLERMHYHINPKVDEPPEVKPPEVEETKPPAPPEPAKPVEPAEPPVVKEPPEPEIPEPDMPPELEEPKLPEEEKPPEEEIPEEEKPELTAPEFISVDIPCFLAVEFFDGAD